MNSVTLTRFASFIRKSMKRVRACPLESCLLGRCTLNGVCMYGTEKTSTVTVDHLLGTFDKSSSPDALQNSLRIVRKTTVEDTYVSQVCICIRGCVVLYCTCKPALLSLLEWAYSLELR